MIKSSSFFRIISHYFPVSGKYLVKECGERIAIIASLFLLFQIQVSFAGDIAYNGYDVIRNGSFEEWGGWFNLNRCIIESANAKDGKKAMNLTSGPSDDPAYCYQQLTIPSVLDSASIRFDYQAQEYPYSNDESYYPVDLQVLIGKNSGTDIVFIGALPTIPVDSTFDWREYRATVDHELITAIRTAHQEGEYLYVIVVQSPAENGGNARYGYVSSIDNFSLSVDGTQQVPEMEGMIAYSADDADANPVSVGLIDPNTRADRTIWTRPGGAGYYGADVAWSPDGSEIAFVSDHERNSSALTGDIYAIKPDGSGLRKITGPSINQGNYPLITLTGSVRNTSTLRQYITLTVQGAENGAAFWVDPQQSHDFVIENVAVFGDPDVFAQHITMIYSNDECNRGVVYALPQAPVNNGGADVEISFTDANCIGEPSGNLVPRELTWKYDGSVIFFSMLGFKSIPAYDSKTFSWSEIEPRGGMFSSSFTWSPVDDRYLYADYKYSGSSLDAIFLATEGGVPRILVDNTKDFTQQAWMPDGSGFIYVGRQDRSDSQCDNVFYFDFQNNTITQLTHFKGETIENVGISPDGKHIVYERQIRIGTRIRSELWLMDRLNPVDRWCITDGGSYTHPNWSKAKTAPCTEEDLGDITDDGIVNLADTITALRILSGLSHLPLQLCGDVNGDSRIGVEEAIHALHVTAGRP